MRQEEERHHIIALGGLVLAMKLLFGRRELPQLVLKRKSELMLLEASRLEYILSQIEEQQVLGSISLAAHSVLK